MKRALQILMILIVGAAGGMHLGFLQVVAWSGMLVQNVQDHGIGDALSRTFSGEHPCELCEWISDASDVALGKSVPEGTVSFDSMDFKMIETRIASLTPPPFLRAEFLSDQWTTAANVLRPPLPPPRSIEV